MVFQFRKNILFPHASLVAGAPICQLGKMGALVLLPQIGDFWCGLADISFFKRINPLVNQALEAFGFLTSRCCRPGGISTDSHPAFTPVERIVQHKGTVSRCRDPKAKSFEFVVAIELVSRVWNLGFLREGFVEFGHSVSVWCPAGGGDVWHLVTLHVKRISRNFAKSKEKSGYVRRLRI